VTWATVGRAHASHDLVDVLAATGPSGLAAGLAWWPDGTWWFSLVVVVVVVW